MREVEKRIALLIDADNMPADKVDDILAELSRYGVINIRRAYGNWKKSGVARVGGALARICHPAHPAV